MNNSLNVKKAFRLGLLLIAVSIGTIGCEKNGAELVLDENSTVNVEDLLPNTTAGNLVKRHLRLSMESGVNAESNYRLSLKQLRANPEVGRILFTTYNKVPTQYYLYRTMLVEALKQLQLPESMAYLAEIAANDIPEDTESANAEIDTRIDEIVIRITAVEGLTLLASDSIVDAHQALMNLTTHKDLTVRQMAARGYIKSAIGSANQKIENLRERLPKEEHWYLSLEDTNIKSVEHPEMPEKFEVVVKEVKNSPKISQ